MKCPYCGYDNEENEQFCEECGRMILSESKGIKEQKKNREDKPIISPQAIEVIEELSDIVLYPCLQNYTGAGTELYYPSVNGESLDAFLSNSKMNRQKALELMKSIISLIRRINEAGLIIGTCDMGDLIIEEDKQVIFRASRPFLKKKISVPDISIGEFVAPEVRNNDSENISNHTDVYLSGQIFNRILIRDKYVPNSPESQLFWAYYDRTFPGDVQLYFHQWFGKTLNTYPMKRYRDMMECESQFDKSCDLTKWNPEKSYQIEDALYTHVGTGKSKNMDLSGKDKSQWNEDSIEKWTDKQGKIQAYLLADGISNCSTGSGYLASNIIRKEFLDVLNTKEKSLHGSIKDIQDIVNEIVTKSNNEIYNQAREINENPTGIMGSTLVFLMITGGKAYYYSLGDSKLFLIRQSNVLLLNNEDNRGMIELAKGKTYEEYKSIDNKESLVFYIGGDYANNPDRLINSRDVCEVNLDVGDYFVLCSDGVIDYLGNNIYDTKWDKEQILLRRIAQSKHTLEESAKSIVRLDNENGGGDNLSIIIIKVEEM